MRDPAEYCLFASTPPGPSAHAEAVYDRVWRTDFTRPGFALIDLGPGVDSRAVRAGMVALKRALSEVGRRRGRGAFRFLSMSRFDQQVTTKFHLDGAPAQSLLVLGYEPSAVHSRLFLADYARAAFDLGLTCEQFLKDWNPMYRPGEERLARYVSEPPRPPDGHARILVINNSSQSFAEDGAGSLGVLHKAVIGAPDEALRRIVNSTMLAAGDGDQVGEEGQRRFVETNEISPKIQRY